MRPLSSEKHVAASGRYREVVMNNGRSDGESDKTVWTLWAVRNVGWRVAPSAPCSLLSLAHLLATSQVAVHGPCHA
jgi:hypothetical protein